MKVSRREAASSASIVISVRAPATVHISMTSVTHALLHIEPMGSDITEAPGESASRTTSSTPPSVRPLVKDPTAAMSTMPGMGVVDAATANTLHARLNARATAAQRPRRDKRATWTAMGVDTRGL